MILGAKPKQPVRVHGRVTSGGRNVDGGQIFVFAEGGALMEGMKMTSVEGGAYEIVLDRPGDYVFGVSEEEGGGGAGTQFYVEVPEARWSRPLP